MRHRPLHNKGNTIIKLAFELMSNKKKIQRYRKFTS